MDIEMIKFTGMLSIMLLVGWILITIFFIIVSEKMDKVNKEQMKDMNKENMSKNVLGKNDI